MTETRLVAPEEEPEDSQIHANSAPALIGQVYRSRQSAGALAHSNHGSETARGAARPHALSWAAGARQDDFCQRAGDRDGRKYQGYGGAGH